MGPSLLSIPEELQLAIVAHLSPASGLQRLSLSCKDFRRLSRPLLYNTIRVCLDDKGHVPQVLKSDKLGHQYTRNLIFDHRHAEDYYSLVSAHVEQNIESVLQLMPENGLRRLVIHGRPLRKGVIDMVVERQKALNHLSLPPVLPEMIAPIQLVSRSDSFALLTGDEVWNGIEHYAQVINDTTILEHLAIQAHTHSGPTSENPTTSPYMYRLLLGLRDKSLTLQQLRLVGQNLGTQRFEMLDRMQFEHLKCLHVYQCPGSDVFFEAISEVFERERSSIQLKTLVVDTCQQEEIWQTTATLRALQALLRSFVGLEMLHIRSDVNPNAEMDPFDMSCFDRHHATLQNLYLGMGTNGGGHGLGESDDHWRISLEDATRLLGSCEQLSSVSLAMPEVSLRDVDKNDYDTYKAVLDCITHSSSLRYLRILTWPTAFPEHHGLSYADNEVEIEHHASMYLRQIDKFASKLLQHVASTRDSRSKLAILCIGDTYDIDRTSLDLEPGLPTESELIRIHHSLCYLTGTQRDYFGRESIVAIPIALQELQHVSPESRGITTFGQDVSGPGLDCLDSHWEV